MPEPMLELPQPINQICEIKVEPGILERNLSDNEKTQTPQVDDLIVFGQGPVLKSDTMLKPEPGAIQQDNAEINSWAKTIARAAGELKRAKSVGRIILTGGQTGGPNFPSEAEMMKKVLIEEYGISEKDIIMETKATNTLLNFSNTINLIDQMTKAAPDEHRTVGFLGADFHIPRIKMMAKLYGLDSQVSFSAEQIFRLIAYKTNDQALHSLLDKRLNIDNDLSRPNSRLNWQQLITLDQEELQKQQPKSTLSSPTFFEEQIGENKKGIYTRVRGENRYTAGLIETPSYWIGYLGYLNEPRLRQALSKIDSKNLDKLGIDPKLPYEQLQKQLIEFTTPEKRGFPSEERESGFLPLDSRNKLDELAYGNKKQ